MEISREFSKLLIENLDEVKFGFEGQEIKKDGKIKLFNRLKSFIFSISRGENKHLDLTKVLSFVRSIEFKLTMCKSVNTKANLTFE